MPNTTRHGFPLFVAGMIEKPYELFNTLINMLDTKILKRGDVDDNATTELAGLMSAADKEKLDGISGSGGSNRVTELPVADATTLDKFYTVDRDGAGPDQIYVGIKSVSGVYRFGKLAYSSFSAGGFDANIIDNLNLWLRADTLGYSNGSPVDIWDDNSANENHATGAGSSRPTLVTNVVNGLPVVRFDGVNDLLDFTNPVVAEVSTIFVVAARPGGTGARPLMVLSGVGLYAAIVSSAHWHLYYEGVVDTGKVSSGAFQCLGIKVRNFDDVDFQLNETTPVNLTTGSDFYANGTTRLGADASSTQFGQVDIAEVLVFGRVLDAGEYSQVQDYLIDKYGI